MRKLDETETLVTICDMTYVREVTKLTCIVVCVCISSLTQFAQHAHTHFHLGVHVPPGTGIWRYKLKFEGTPFFEVSNWCSYFDGISPNPQKLVTPIILENFDPQSFLLPEFNMHLLKSATLLFS